MRANKRMCEQTKEEKNERLDRTDQVAVLPVRPRVATRDRDEGADAVVDRWRARAVSSAAFEAVEALAVRRCGPRCCSSAATARQPRCWARPLRRAAVEIHVRRSAVVAGAHLPLLLPLYLIFRPRRCCCRHDARSEDARSNGECEVRRDVWSSEIDLKMRCDWMVPPCSYRRDPHLLKETLEVMSGHPPRAIVRSVEVDASLRFGCPRTRIVGERSTPLDV